MSNTPRLIIASNNPGKVREFRDLLGDTVQIVTMGDLGLDSPEETEDTFTGNAAIKARFLHRHTGEVTLADDSGLVIDALSGRPGVWSARYAGEPPDDAANRAQVLQEMGGVQPDERSARFIAAIVMIGTDGREHVVEGVCEGSIGFEERGTNGFGYDSIFTLPNGQTMAELTSEEKGRISHRGNALRQLLPVLRSELGLGTEP